MYWPASSRSLLQRSTREQYVWLLLRCNVAYLGALQKTQDIQSDYIRCYQLHCQSASKSASRFSFKNGHSFEAIPLAKTAFSFS